MTLKETALEYHRNNICVLPANPKTKRPTLSAWKPYTTTMPNEKEIIAWFSNGTPGLSIVCGGDSMIEVIDADNHFHDAEQNMILFKELLQDDALWNKLVIEQTQSGGYHIIYRCTEIEGNQKLAQRLNDEGNPDVIFETRGQGGIIIAAPSPGYQLVKNNFSNIPTITPEERQKLLAVGRSFHEIEPPDMVHSNDYTQNTFEDRPGDAYNQKGDIIAELLSDGWSIFRQDGDKYHLSRPGVTDHPSATFNHIPNKLYVFSTSADLPDNKALDKFATYAYLRHRGDFKAAASDLLSAGYGTATTAVKTLNAKPTKTNAKKDTAPAKWVEDKLKGLYDYRYNIVKSRFQIKDNNEWEDISDRKIKEIWRYFQNIGYSVGIDRIRNIIESDFSPDYNPFEEYFKGLPAWDGYNRIYDLATEIIKVEPEQTEYWYDYLQRWMVAAVATALEKAENHTCIVMIGGQGVGKTRSIERIIIPPELFKGYYHTGDIDPKDKDSKIAIAENFVVNLDELESASHENIGHLKSLITMKQVTVRRPYGRYSDTMKRRASFIASINNEQFLMDLTGSRRFLIVNITEVDTDAKIDHSQLWAQALSMFNANYRFWYNQKEIADINDRNLRYQLSISEDDYVSTFLIKPHHLSKDNYIQELTATEIIDFIIRKLNKPIKARPNLLGKVLARNGFKRINKRVNGHVKYVWRIEWADPIMNNVIQDNGDDNAKF